MADKDALRAELEATRAAFVALAEGLSSADWRRRSGNRAWNVRQVMSHIATSVGPSAGSINMVRQGKGFNPPGFLTGPVNVILTRIAARKATAASVIETYNEGHAKLLTALETVADDEWDQGARFFGKPETIESLVRGVISHFHEHEADVTRGAGRVDAQ